MVYTVSITSQGQISIPAKLRRKLGLHKNQKALVSEEKGKLIVEPVKDFLKLGGSLHYKAVKGKTIDEVIKLEEEAVERGFIEQYKEKLKRNR